MAEDTQRNHQELCLLYENSAANLESLKKSQWQVYVFYSAVVGALISQADNIKEPYLKILTFFLLVMGALMVEFYEAHFRLKMKGYRQILMEVYEGFGHPFNKIRTSPKGSKTVDPDNFEIAFKHGGCAYLFAVGLLAINIFWPEVPRLKYCSMIWPLLMSSISLLVLAWLIPLVMDRLADYAHEAFKKKI